MSRTDPTTPASSSGTGAKDDPGVTLPEVKAYLHLDDPPAEDETDDADLWVMVLDCWRSLKGTLHQVDVPPRLLLQVVAIRYNQPRAHRTAPHRAAETRKEGRGMHEREE